MVQEVQSTITHIGYFAPLSSVLKSKLESATLVSLRLSFSARARHVSLAPVSWGCVMFLVSCHVSP